MIIPFMLDSSGQRLICLTEIEAEIEASRDTDLSGSLPTNENHMDLLVADMIDDESGLPGPLLSASSGYSLSPDYIIITSTELKDSFEPFAIWKRSLGFNVEIKTIEAIQAEQNEIDLEEKIREYLKTCYADGLEWVLIGGDETVVPIRKLYSANTDEPVPVEYTHPSDLYYGDLTGDWDVDGDGVWGEPYHDNPDLQPEIFVGRLPASSPDNITNWIWKTINYENGGVLGAEGYADRVLITSADHMRDWNNGQGQDSLIAGYLPERIDPDLTSMAEIPTGDDPDPLQPSAHSFIGRYSEGWNLTVILAHGSCNGFVTMSSGYGGWPKTFVWAGEGSGSSHGYLDNLTNYGAAGIVYSIGCSQGAIDGDQPPFNCPGSCVAEYMLRLENRGAAAFIGYSRYGWVASSYRLAEKFVDYIYSSDNRLGPANTYSKLCHSVNRDLNYGLNLFGDPSLGVWRDAPGRIEIDHPELITLGENLFSSQVTSVGEPVDSALVTVITKDDNLFYGYTGSDGRIEISFDSGTDSAVILTVSKSGYVPYTANLATSIILDAEDDYDDRTELPREFTLFQNYPNPANPSTTVSFELPECGDIRLEIFNILGQKVKDISREELPAGFHEIELDFSDNPSGVYFYKITNFADMAIKKLMVLK